MKATGIVRRLDGLGRIVLPKDIREMMDLPIETPMEIYIDNDYILLHKYQPACILCNSTDNVHFIEGKRLCEECLNKIAASWLVDPNK